jgi:Ca2+-binding RTX toxin-like protein
MEYLMNRRPTITALAALTLCLLAPLPLDASAAGATTPSCFGHTATIVSNAAFVPGTPGSDVIVTGSAANEVFSDTGNDRVCTHGGKDFVRGDSGDDRINLGPGDDKASGGSLSLDPNDLSGNDVIVGGDGNDELNGKDGDDVLRGGFGRDTLRGGPGTDTCYPGPGVDTVVGCEHVL